MVSAHHFRDDFTNNEGVDVLDHSNSCLNPLTILCFWRLVASKALKSHTEEEYLHIICLKACG
jgi:hypothetical protein